MTFPKTRDVIVERDGGILRLTLNRPAARNALTHDMMRELGAVLTAIEADASLRAVIVRGAGGHFCAGGDLDFMADMPPPPAPGKRDPLYEPYRYYGEVLRRFDRLAPATVAVVEGAAAGGGFGLACCSDVVIAAASAVFAMPEPRAGFIPSQIIPFVTRTIGIAAARRLAVTGMRISGAEAADLGIVDYVCADGEAIAARLAEVVEQIRHCEPAAVAAVKRLVLASAEEPLEAVLDAAAESLIELLRSPNAREGIAAFKEKRPPRWARE